MRSSLTAVGALALLSPAAVTAQDLSCPGFEAGEANSMAADRLYVRRAINVVDRALANDLVGLSTLVAPEAEFEVWRGDSGLSPRDPGLTGVAEFFRRLHPTSFQSTSGITGPIAVIQSECTWNVTVLFRTDEPDEGVSFEFKFHDGLLVSALGREVVLMEGSLGKSAAAD